MGYLSLASYCFKGDRLRIDVSRGRDATTKYLVLRMSYHDHDSPGTENSLGVDIAQITDHYLGLLTVARQYKECWQDHRKFHFLIK